jgi:hypothetical protein
MVSYNRRIHSGADQFAELVRYQYQDLAPRQPGDACL